MDINRSTNDREIVFPDKRKERMTMNVKRFLLASLAGFVALNVAYVLLELVILKLHGRERHQAHGGNRG
ncbi:MAG: hypothetical protein AAB281_04995 [Actinomycetota bacterium]